MNQGVETLMKLARFAARRTVTEGERVELRGMNGTMNLEFTGPDGGAWHVTFADGRIRMAPGPGAAPRATVRLAPADFLAMVAGDLSQSVARMTGRVRVAGDGNFGIAFAAFVGSLRNAQTLPGVRGWLARRLIGRALGRGGRAPRRNTS
jgi:putative sterol carrier protein